MSDQRKRVHWKRFANDAGQVRSHDRAGAVLNPGGWRLRRGDGPGDGEAAIRGWLMVSCIAFVVFTAISAKQGMWAWRSPLLTLTGCAACVVFKSLVLLAGAVAWVLTGDEFILTYGSCEFPFGHHGLLRVVLAALTVAVVLFWGIMELVRRYVRTDGARSVVLKCIWVALTLLYAAILQVVLLRILAE
jgi:hypothetical protein